MSLTVALSKGKLLSGTEALFHRAGLPFPDGEGRRLVAEAGDLRFLFVKDMDVPTYVEYGVADCGVAGRDVLLETGADVLEPLDLGFGRPLPAVGFMLGLDRVALLLERQGRAPEAEPSSVAKVHGGDLGTALAEARARRASGARVRFGNGEER